MRIASYSVNGVRKKTNQDGLCFLAAETSFGPVVFAAVCDGVGGLEDGELASSVVIRRFSRWFEEGLPAYLTANCRDGVFDLSGLSAVWSGLLHEANADILSYGDAEGAALGTTFSGIIVCGTALLIGHVGDCRVYRYADAQLECLTKDQTWVAEEVAAGNLTEEEALHHPRSNVILQAVGTQPDLEPAFTMGGVQPGDLFMLCCDGLYRDIPESRIVEACGLMANASQETMQETCEQLVQEAIANGSVDNVTIVCFAYDALDDGSPRAVSGQSATGGHPGQSSVGADDSPTLITKDSRTVLVPEPGPSNHVEGGGGQ